MNIGNHQNCAEQCYQQLLRPQFSWILWSTDHPWININWFKTPAESPDLNVIENVWAAMKSYMGNEAPRTQDPLFATLLTFWNSHLNPAQWNRYINHIHKVIPKVIEVQGGFPAINNFKCLNNFMWGHIGTRLVQFQGAKCCVNIEKHRVSQPPTLLTLER